MKAVVATEVERFVFRPGLKDRAQYYAVIFLNQMVLSHKDSEGVLPRGSLPAKKFGRQFHTPFAARPTHRPSWLKHLKLLAVKAHILGHMQSDGPDPRALCIIGSLPPDSRHCRETLSRRGASQLATSSHACSCAQHLDKASLPARKDCQLGQPLLPMPAGGSVLANKLIDIYFTLFKMILEGHAGHAAAATKSQEEAAAAAQPKKNRHRCVECLPRLLGTPGPFCQH